MDFPGGPVAGSPPASAGDTSSIPRQGGSNWSPLQEDPTCMQGSWAHAPLAAEPVLQSLHFAAAELTSCTYKFRGFLYLKKWNDVIAFQAEG